MNQETQRVLDEIRAWQGEKDFPGWCKYCGEHRSFHREGLVTCIQSKKKPKNINKWLYEKYPQKKEGEG